MKKEYIAPQIEIVLDTAPAVLYTATITQGDDDDPDNPLDIDAKGFTGGDYYDTWDDYLDDYGIGANGSWDE